MNLILPHLGIMNLCCQFQSKCKIEREKKWSKNVLKWDMKNMAVRFGTNQHIFQKEQLCKKRTCASQFQQGVMQFGYFWGPATASWASWWTTILGYWISGCLLGINTEDNTVHIWNKQTLQRKTKKLHRLFYWVQYWFLAWKQLQQKQLGG